MTISPGEAAAIYACSDAFAVHEQLVLDDEFHQFSDALDALLIDLGDIATDDPWQAAVRSLRRLRFDMMAAPVRFRDAGGQAAREQLASLRGAAQTALPRIEPVIARTIDAIEALAGTAGNPLLDAIVGESSRGAGSGTPVLLCESRLLDPARTAAARAGSGKSLRWMTPHQMRAAVRMDRIVVVGAPHWFPRHVFRAPRAPVMASVRHGWVRVNWDRASIPDFETAEDEVSAPRRPLPIHRDRTWQGVRARFALDEEDAVPPLPMPGLFKNAGKSDDGYAASEADAIVVRLEGDEFVLLESDGSTHIIDPDEDYRVRIVSASGIPAGAFLLLRTEGGGDYVAQVADALLGTEATPAREAQDTWKAGLREAAAERGASAVIGELRSHGSARADPSNLRNWMSPRNIRTRDRTDFAAILAVAGLADRADGMWRTMGRIAAAHRMAGQRIRARLMAEVEKADPQDLERDGRIDFEMDEGGGSLTAFRVVGVLPDRVQAARRHLDRVLGGARAEW